MLRSSLPGEGLRGWGWGRGRGWGEVCEEAHQEALLGVGEEIGGEESCARDGDGLEVCGEAEVRGIERKEGEVVGGGCGGEECYEGACGEDRMGRGRRSRAAAGGGEEGAGRFREASKSGGGRVASAAP